MDQLLPSETQYVSILSKSDPEYDPRVRKCLCLVCESFFPNVSHVRRHLLKHRERERKDLLGFTRDTVSQLPLDSKLCSSHEKGLETLLRGIYERESYGLEALQVIQEEVKSLIQSAGIPEISQILHYGSTASGFALKGHSALDFVLVVETIHIKKTFEGLLEYLSSSPDVATKVESGQKGRDLLISWTYKAADTPVILTLRYSPPRRTHLLLRAYWRLEERVRVLGVGLRFWALSLGLTNNKDSSIPSLAFIIMLMHYLIHEKVLPCVWDWKKAPDGAGEGNEEEKENAEDTLDPEDPVIQEKLSSWKSPCAKNLAQLWIGFFKYYACEFDVRDSLVSITSSEPEKKTERLFKFKRLTVTEPYQFKATNLFRVIQNMITFNFIETCLIHSAYYFGVPRISSGPLFKFLMEKDGKKKQPSFVFLEDDITSDFFLTPSEATLKLKSLQEECIVLKWAPEEFSNHAKMPIICSVCAAEGHNQDSCPDEALLSVPDYPPLSENDHNKLATFLEENTQRLEISEKELKERNEFLKYAMGFIRRSGYPNAVLRSFGSTENGFGFKNSDLDLCLTFEGHESSEFDPPAVIKDIADKMYKLKGLQNVRPITSAKVPIIKFSYTYSSLQGDISLYNCLALSNTMLLRAYRNIDDRLKILGYNLKAFMKVCDFGDASRGSLSSYTCIVMAIYYLQRTQPPILPFLQEMYDDDKSSSPPTQMVDGHNVWFNDSASSIQDWRKSVEINSSTPAELIIGFFNFFGRQFDSEKEVVSIRSSKPMSKLDKMWVTNCLAVEDPFEVNRNLGGSLSRKMHLFIKKCFIKGYEKFSTPMLELYNFKVAYKYFLNASSLGVDKAPTDRGCHICGGIWHIARECPRKLNSKRYKKGRGENKKGGGEDAPNRVLPTEWRREPQNSPRVARPPVRKMKSEEDPRRPDTRQSRVFINSDVRETGVPEGDRSIINNNGRQEEEGLRILEDVLQGFNLQSEEESQRSNPRFIQGVIRSEDLERIAFKSSSPDQPPPGFFPTQQPYGGFLPPRANHFGAFEPHNGTTQQQQQLLFGIPPLHLTPGPIGHHPSAGGGLPSSQGGPPFHEASRGPGLHRMPQGGIFCPQQHAPPPYPAAPVAPFALPDSILSEEHPQNTLDLQFIPKEFLHTHPPNKRN